MLNKSKLRSVVLWVIVILIFISIPFIFNWIFHGDESTVFLSFTSSMSVSDWFSFWVSYLSFIASSILAFAALKFSKMIEINNRLTDIDKNIPLFKFNDLKVDIDSSNTATNEYAVVIVMPLDVLSLNGLQIVSAKITFDRKEFFEFQLSKEDNNTTFTLKPHNNEKDDKIIEYGEKLVQWNDWVSLLTPGYKSLWIEISYEYNLPAIYEHRKDFICTTKVLYEVKSPTGNNDNVEITQMHVLEKKLSNAKKGKQK